MYLALSEIFIDDMRKVRISGSMIVPIVIRNFFSNVAFNYKSRKQLYCIVLKKSSSSSSIDQDGVLFVYCVYCVVCLDSGPSNTFMPQME